MVVIHFKGLEVTQPGAHTVHMIVQAPEGPARAIILALGELWAPDSILMWINHPLDLFWETLLGFMMALS